MSEPGYTTDLSRLWATAPWPRRPVCYAPPTRRKETLESMRKRGWRTLIQPTRPDLPPGMMYALDNGAWEAAQRGETLSEMLFEAALNRYGRKADWVVVPDVVGDGRATLAQAERWLPRVEAARAHPMIAVQDGMEPADVAAWVGYDRAGVFLGGTTEWKWARIMDWARFAHGCGARFHVARVNTRNHVHAAIRAGAHSIDGSTAVRFPDTISMVNGAVLDGGP